MPPTAVAPRPSRDLEDGLVATVAGALDAAGVGGPDPYLRARVVIVAIESLVHRLLATEQPHDTDDVVDEIVRLLATEQPHDTDDVVDEIVRLLDADLRA